MTSNNTFSDLCAELERLHEEKNRLYGNSFSENVEDFGIVAAIIPISNKFKRIKQLVKGEEPNFESIEDSLIDLASYALMTVDEIRNGSLRQYTEKREYDFSSQE